MKRKLLFLIFLLLIFSDNVFAASKINSMSINVLIDEAGIATVHEEWQISSQTNNYYEKKFMAVDGVEVSDLVITDSNESNYTYVDKFNKNRSLTYNYQESNRRIRFCTDNKEATIKLDYKVKGMITKFSDFESINWTFLAPIKFDIAKLDIIISGPFQFNETNTALYGIGNNISCEFLSGDIHISSLNLTEKSQVRLIASLSTNLFSEYIEVNEKLVDYYEEITSTSPLSKYMRKVVDNVFFSLIVIILVITLVIILVNKFKQKEKLGHDYKNIISYKKLRELPDTEYYDSLPCSSDLYKIYFLANYYNVIKHRSSLIGSILLKWIFAGFIELSEDDEDYILVLNKDIKFVNALDSELYELLLAASSNGVLDKNKIKRLIKNNNKDIINWYDKVVLYVMEEEYKLGNVTVKGHKVYMNKTLYEEALKVSGLKKYLLNFNQVPRKTRLTEPLYINLLISSILLRVDENLADEILRKNPDNSGAKILKEFAKVKKIYRNIYSSSYEEFKKNKKNRRLKNRYIPVKKDTK